MWDIKLKFLFVLSMVKLRSPKYIEQSLKQCDVKGLAASIRKMSDSDCIKLDTFDIEDGTLPFDVDKELSEVQEITESTW